MVEVSFESEFKKIFCKIKSRDVKVKILKQLAKIRDSPEIGKPMRYTRKGTREVYVSPFRISYIYYKEENKVVLPDLYHKDEQ